MGKSGSWSKWSVWIALAAVAVLTMPWGGAWAGKIVDFTAEQVVLNKKGKVEQQAKLAATAEKISLEVTPPKSDKPVVYTHHRDLKQTVIANTEKKAFWQGPLDEKMMTADKLTAFKAKSEKALGSEAVSGFNCVKKEIETEIDVTGKPKAAKFTVWMSEQFELPLRVQDAAGRVTELRNIKEGKPDKALFEPPKDFKQTDKLINVLPEKYDPFMDDD